MSGPSSLSTPLVLNIVPLTGHPPNQLTFNSNHKVIGDQQTELLALFH